MTNRERVITHLDDLRLFADVTVHPVVSPDNWGVYSSLCDYIDQIKTEVEILLKEQEPVKPILSAKDRCYYCGNCDETEVKTYDHYCPKCGRELKW